MLSAEELGRLFPAAGPEDRARLERLQRLGLAHGMSGRWPRGEFERDAAWQADIGASIAWLERRLDDECILPLYAGAHAAGLARRDVRAPRPPIRRAAERPERPERPAYLPPLERRCDHSQRA